MKNTDLLLNTVLILPLFMALLISCIPPGVELKHVKMTKRIKSAIRIRPKMDANVKFNGYSFFTRSHALQMLFTTPQAANIIQFI